MTLRDKLKPTTSISTEGEARRFADKSVIIAEDFAIGFANWLQVDVIIDLIENHTTRELLEIYKKTLLHQKKKQ